MMDVVMVRGVIEFMRLYFSTISCEWSVAGILPETFIFMTYLLILEVNIYNSTILSYSIVLLSKFESVNSKVVLSFNF